MAEEHGDSGLIVSIEKISYTGLHKMSLSPTIIEEAQMHNRVYP